MMNNLPIVSGSTIAAMFIASFLCIAIPITLMLVLRKKNGTKFAYFFIGCAAFFIFALVIEGLINNIVLLGTPFGKALPSNIWLYGLYGGLMAGLFEETGRFVAFKTLMRKSNRLSDSLMYGAGHGGIESILIAGLTVAVYAVLCILSNMGLLTDMIGAVDEASATQLGAIITQYAEGSAFLPALVVVERLSAISFHIAASVLVYIAARKKEKLWLYPLAILLHAALDLVAVVASRYSTNIVLVEASIMVFSALVCVGAGLVYKNEKDSIEACTSDTAASTCE